MITSVDTNVLLDVFHISSAAPGAVSGMVARCLRQRVTLLICDIVYAELVPAFGERVALNRALREIGITLSPINTDHRLGSRNTLDAVPAGRRAAQDASSPTSLSAPTPPYLGRRLPHSRPRLLHLLLPRTEESLTEQRAKSATICRADEPATYHRTAPTTPCPILRASAVDRTRISSIRACPHSIPHC